MRLKRKQVQDRDKSLYPVSDSELVKGLHQKCGQITSGSNVGNRLERDKPRAKKLGNR